MIIRLGLAIFVSAWVGLVFWGEKKRTAVHHIVLVGTVLLAITTFVTAVTHYREVRFLKTLAVNDLIYVSVGEAPTMTDRDQLQNVVAGLRTPEDFLASRDNHGNEVDFTLGFKNGKEKVFTISRAARTRGVVVRIKGGGTVLYKGLEWLIPASI